MFADVSGDGEIDTAEFVEWLTADTKPSSATTGTAAESAVGPGGGDGEEEEDEEEAPSVIRNQTMHTIVQSMIFSVVLGGLILLNLIVLAADHHGIDPELDARFEQVNTLLTLIFLGEIIGKLIAFTTEHFWGDPFNIFDFAIVFVGCLELLSNVVASLNVFRAFRIFVRMHFMKFE